MYKRNFLMNMNRNQQGFTLMEVLVATAIFVLVVSGMLTLFTQTLKINRRVQSVRELVQGTRAFTETISREVRNGRIDYQSWDTDPDCNATNYALRENKSLAILRNNGDKICFYLDEGGDFYMKKKIPSGTTRELVFSADRFRIIPGSFRFNVYPSQDPNPDCGAVCSDGSYPEVQPFVTIVAQFELDNSPSEPTSIINYQTTISTDVYDIPKQ